MEVGEHINALDDAGRRFAQLVGVANLDAAVPPCPGWNVRELARHLGGVQRWATRYVAEARTTVIDADLEEIVGGWPDDDDLPAWFVAGHQRLVDALVAAPADLDCFTFLEAPSPLAMWARRQAHETSIHRVDAEAASGSLTPFPPEFALDGINELLTAFITRPGRGPRALRECSLAVLPIDESGQWTVRFDPDSCRTDRDVTVADVTVTGAASDLYMWVWNRPTIGAVTFSGDLSVVEMWKDTAHVRWS